MGATPRATPRATRWNIGVFGVFLEEATERGVNCKRFIGVLHQILDVAEGVAIPWPRALSKIDGGAPGSKAPTKNGPPHRARRGIEGEQRGDACFGRGL